TGRAASFDGKAYLDAGEASNFDIEDPFTISTWVRPDGPADSSLISKMVDSPRGKGWGVHFSQGKVYVQFVGVWESDGIRMESESSVDAQGWNQITVTYSGSRQAEGVHVYVNGRRIAMKVVMDNLYRPFNNSGIRFTQPLRIGAGWGPARRFRGLISDLRVY